MLRYVKLWALLLSVCYIAVGLLLLVMPYATLPWLCLFFSAVVLVTGAVQLVRYFRSKEKNLTALFTLVGGAVTTGLGLFALLRPDYVEWILPVVFGLFVLVDGGMRFASGWQLVKRKGQRWWAIMLLGLVSEVIGFWMIWEPFQPAPFADPILLCGVLLVLEGALNLGCSIYTAMELNALDRAQTAAENAKLAAVGELADAMDEEEAAPTLDAPAPPVIACEAQATEVPDPAGPQEP